MEDDSGQIHDYTGIRNLITSGFACEMTNRYSCYECKFAGTHRKSDFTIGDYWGVSDYKEEHYGGVSVIIAHSNNAVSFLSEAHIFLETHKVDISDIVNHNKRINSCKDKRYMLPERKYLAYAFSHFNYKSLKAVYAFDFNKYSLWIIYKVYRFIIQKILEKL